MTESEYKSIRGEKNFVFRYYQKNKGILQEPVFNQLFNMWLLQFVGVQPSEGIKYILHFLDKKFGYKQNNA